MHKDVQAEVCAPRFTVKDLSPALAAVPMVSGLLVYLMRIVDGRVGGGKWSARRTLLFIVLSSVLLWALIISGALWLLEALHPHLR